MHTVHEATWNHYFASYEFCVDGSGNVIYVGVTGESASFDEDERVLAEMSSWTFQPTYANDAPATVCAAVLRPPN